VIKSCLLPGEAGGVEGVAFIVWGEDVFEEQGAAGLDGGEAVLFADAVNGFV
jgi:hypothetical protein